VPNRSGSPAFRSLNADCLSSLLSASPLWQMIRVDPAWGPEGTCARRGLAVKILIADDNRLMLEGFRRALEQVRDIEIAGVTDCGAEVLGLVERRRPDVVALELGLRTRDGRSCLEALCAEHPHVKVVVLSATATPEIIRAAVSAGARAFITKNVNPLDIPSAIRQAYDGTVYHIVASSAGPDDALRDAGLTAREITMLKALARGLTNKAISQELWVTEQTVKFHLGNVYRKLGVPNRLAAATFAHRQGVRAA
jgi:DNA-binding NarL/FixJ family response regulator